MRVTSGAVDGGADGAGDEVEELEHLREVVAAEVELDLHAAEVRKSTSQYDDGYFRALRVANPRAREILVRVREASLAYRRKSGEALASGRPAIYLLQRAIESEREARTLAKEILRAHKRSQRKQ